MKNTKKCTGCGRELPLEEFYKKKYKNGNTGIYSHCVNCHNAITSKWRKDNLDRMKILQAKWHQDNKEEKKRYNAEWYQKNKKHRADYIRKRKNSDPEFKISQNIKTLIYIALRGNAKCGSSIELLGCSTEELKNHLERLFSPGMTWENYGRYGWHIDHIIPLSYFDFTDPEQQKRAWHYTNLQPLWATDNLKKSDDIEERQLTLL